MGRPEWVVAVSNVFWGTSALSRFPRSPVLLFPGSLVPRFPILKIADTRLYLFVTRLYSSVTRLYSSVTRLYSSVTRLYSSVTRLYSSVTRLYSSATRV